MKIMLSNFLLTATTLFGMGGGLESASQPVTLERAGRKIAAEKILGEKINMDPQVEAHTVQDNRAQQRQYYLYTPGTYQSGRKLPLVLVFHGFKGSALQMMKMTGFNEVAEKEGFLVAYANVAKDRWSAASAPTDMSDEDITFVQAMIRNIKANRDVDPARIYATGFSNGGFFTERLACEMSDQIAAFAPVAATMGGPLQKSCQPTRPVPIILINGTDDPIITWKGKIKRVRYAFRDSVITSVPQAVEFWRKQDQCDVAPRVNLFVRSAHSTGTGTQINAYQHCTAPAAVQQVVVYNGGHTWPGSSDKIGLGRLVLGRPSYDINASEVIWSFFKDYTHP
jgi:polyhydroxybutyrate depolymerase